MKTQLKIKGMSCNHCVNSVRTALEAVPGVESAQVDLATGLAVVDHQTPIDLVTLITAVEEEEFEAEGIPNATQP